MYDLLTGLVLCLTLVVAAVCLWLIFRDQPAEDRTYALLGVVEAVLLVQLVVGAIALSRTTDDVSGVLFVSYLIGVVLALPVGAFWSLAERTRAGTAVLLLAALTVAGLEVRLESIWGGAGA